ncbi:MAG TPA: hypothetical protein VMD06_01340 [Steroidobacteraceae bacterium]|nr:hypothetical protein [Steroidobacteraceae bacterium]
MSAVAAAFVAAVGDAVADGAVADGAVVPGPAVGAELEPALFGSVAEFWARRVVSAAAVLLLPASMWPPCDGAPLVAVAGLAAVPTAGTASSAPANAFCRSVRALETVSAPECFAAGSLESPASHSPLALLEGMLGAVGLSA